MYDQHPADRGAWPTTRAAAIVGADPVRRTSHTVEGPTLHEREPAFDLGLAAVDRAPTCFGRSSRASARAFGPGRLIARRALLLVAVALAVAGCGGEPTELLNTPEENAAGGTPTETAPASTVAAEESPRLNEISGASAKPGELVKLSAITPKRFSAAHCSKVIAVLFYQPESLVDEALLSNAQAATKGRENVVTLAYTPADVKSYGDLPSKLGLLATPGLAIVDRSGKIETFWTSYVDQQLIEYQLDRAASAQPCKLTAEDVPAAGSALKDAALVAGGGKPASQTAGTTAAGTPATAATGTTAAGAIDPLTGLPASTAPSATTPATGALPAGGGLTSAPAAATDLAGDMNASPSLNPDTAAATQPPVTS